MGPVAPAPRLGVSLIVSALLLSGCGPGGGPSPVAGPDQVTVAAFGFSESRILVELYAQVMEAGGLPVRRALDLASREVVEPALEQGAVDFVPEYSGTALEFLNRAAGQATADAGTTYELLRAAFSARGVTALERAPAQNQNALAVTRATADRLRLRQVSDLGVAAPTLVFGGPPECPERRFCLPGLVARYGLTFKEFVPLDAAGPLTIGALEGDEVDVALLFTTSSAVEAAGLVLLVDDRELQPAENVVPVVRTSVLDRHGDALRDPVDAVSRLLTTSELVGLNRRVDVEGVTPQDAARDWLLRHSLVPA